MKKNISIEEAENSVLTLQNSCHTFADVLSMFVLLENAIVLLVDKSQDEVIAQIPLESFLDSKGENLIINFDEMEVSSIFINQNEYPSQTVIEILMDSTQKE